MSSERKRVCEIFIYIYIYMYSISVATCKGSAVFQCFECGTQMILFAGIYWESADPPMYVYRRVDLEHTVKVPIDWVPFSTWLLIAYNPCNQMNTAWCYFWCRWPTWSILVDFDAAIRHVFRARAVVPAFPTLAVV